MAYAFSNEKSITCSKTYDNKRRTQDTPARSSEKTLMQKRTLKNEAVVRSSRKWVVSFATHLKWEYWLLGMATFTNKGSCLEEDVKHGQIMSSCFLTLFNIVLPNKDLHQKWYLAKLTVFHMSQALRYDHSEEKEQC